MAKALLDCVLSIVRPNEFLYLNSLKLLNNGSSGLASSAVTEASEHIASGELS